MCPKLDYILIQLSFFFLMRAGLGGNSKVAFCDLSDLGITVRNIEIAYFHSRVRLYTSGLSIPCNGRSLIHWMPFLPFL